MTRACKRAVAVLVTSAVAAVTATPAVAQAPPQGFSSSFETGDPAPDWLDDAERASGVAGPEREGIPGDVTDTVADVRVSAENAAGGEIADNLIDGSSQTKWLAFASTAWIEYELKAPVAVKRYALISANDSPDRDPRNWTLSGSDDGQTWTKVDERSGETFSARFQKREFAIENASAYRHYRLDVTANGGATIVQLAELRISDGSTAPPQTNTTSRVGDGPADSYTAKRRVGFTGLRSLRYAGRHTADGRGYSYNRLFDVNVAITPDSELSYLIHPDFADGGLNYASTYAAIDLAFTDGTFLSELGAKDQHGFVLSPQGQGDSKTLAPKQWNLKRAHIGAVAAGKTVDRILVAYDNPDGPGDFGGWVDDVKIDGSPQRPDRDRPSDWVLTTRGTMSNGGYSRGNNFPAAAVPNGFNFWTPVTDAGSMGSFYRYHEDNNAANLPEIEAFSASHQPSIWIQDRQTFQVMPSIAQGVPAAGRQARALAFRHENEVATAHHYGVRFENGLRTDIAPTDHAALFRFRFPAQGGRHLIFDNIDNRSGLTIDAAAGTVSGWSETRLASPGMTRMFMYATFDAPITGSGMLPTGNRPSTGYVSFGRDEVTMRIATSLISVAQAKKNLELEIAADDDFDDVAGRAQTAWDKLLGVVEVEDATDDQRTTLYSNLYRLFLYPNSAHENVGTAENPRWQHADQATASGPPAGSTPTQTAARILDGKLFVNMGFWDTFRSAWPAYSLLAPKLAGEVVDGFVQMYRDNGWISPWSNPGYARVMTGTNSDAAFADAFVKGVPGINATDTYLAALKNATVRPDSGAIGRHGLERSTFLGFVPNNVGGAGFSWSLDGYVNDFAIAAMGEAMANQPGTSAADRKRLLEEARYLRARSQGYADLFDPSIGFFQGKSATGEWTTPPGEYDPESWGNDHDYTEANGWNEAFPAPHDGEGLARLYGGRADLAAKLDAFFSTPEAATKPGSYGSVIHEMRETRDLRLGQWAIPNQVSHHIPWMYVYTQQPWKAHEQVRHAVERGWLGSEIGQGYPGDEDNGATSAWWILSAIGLYPLPVTGDYAIGSPLFEKATLHLPGGDVVLEAPGTSTGKEYVQSLTVDGKPHTGTSIAHAEIADGAHLRFTMGEERSDWGTGAGDVPKSVTKVGEQPRQLHDLTTSSDTGALRDDDSRTATVLRGTAPSLQYTVNGNGETKVSFYTLTSSIAAAAQDPASWVLEGSDDGQRWTELDRRSGETFRWRNQTRPFELAEPSDLRHFRLRFESTGTLSLAEIELLTKDEIAVSPLRVEVGNVSLQPGATTPLEIRLTNNGDAPVSPALTVGAPSGWFVFPGQVDVPAIAPGASRTVTVGLTPGPGAPPRPEAVQVTARWDDWMITAQGTARVVGDVVEIEPGTAYETEVMVENNSSQLGGDGAGQARYTDNANSFTYRLPVMPRRSGTVTLDIANQFLVEVSSDRTTWKEVLREPTAATGNSNRAQRALDLAELRALAGGSTLFLRFSDSRPQDGWGGWLAGVRIETVDDKTATEVPGTVGGSVPATLALTLSGPGSFGAFVPGVERTYTADMTANVVSSAGNATLSVTDADTARTGHLVNGAHALPQPLQGLGTLKTWDAPVSNEAVPVRFQQAIGATDPLRSGTYAKTLTFTLATTAP